MSRYRFIRAEKAAYPVTILCRVLHIARSGYYAWARRGVSTRATADKALTDQITLIHGRSRHTYGTPRVHAALRASGVCCGSRRVARLMRAAGLAGCRRRRRARTTVADPGRVPAPNLVARAFAAPVANRLWLGDITYVPTWEGWLYVAVLLDACSRRVVGWAMAESFFATLKAELIDARPWPTRRGARQAIFEWVEIFYNRQRSHSALDYQSPVAFELALAAEAQPT